MRVTVKVRRPSPFMAWTALVTVSLRVWSRTFFSSRSSCSLRAASAVCLRVSSRPTTWNSQMHPFSSRNAARLQAIQRGSPMTVWIGSSVRRMPPFSRSVFSSPRCSSKKLPIAWVGRCPGGRAEIHWLQTVMSSIYGLGMLKTGCSPASLSQRLKAMGIGFCEDAVSMACFLSCFLRRKAGSGSVGFVEEGLFRNRFRKSV